MATVFIFNGNLLAFFHKNGFRLDESSPTSEEMSDYVILSRNVLPGKERSTNNENAEMENDIISQLLKASIKPKENEQIIDTSKSIILKASAEAKKAASIKANENIVI